MSPLTGQGPTTAASGRAGAVQDYESDALQEQVNATPLLITRLGQWNQAVDVVYNYVLGYHHTQTAITTSLEKTRKTIAEVPQFLGNGQVPGEGGTRSPTGQVTGVHPPSSPIVPTSSTPGAVGEKDTDSPVSLSNAFLSLQTKTDALINESSTAAVTIKQSILPNLDMLRSEIDTHFKKLRTSGQKSLKEVEKARDTTQKFVERLAKQTAAHGATKIEAKEDPYVLHRHVQSHIVDQVQKENIQAESALNAQRHFASLENHISEVLRTSLEQLRAISEEFANVYAETHGAVHNNFSRIDVDSEWTNFTKQNSESLLSESNYQRDPQNVVFSNWDHASTVPLMEGVLHRKTTVLKSFNQSFYVLTKSGFLHQFKSQDPGQDPAPELSLYLPDSGLGSLPARTSGDLSFKIISKNAKRSMLGAKHKYQFRASSYEELLAWYNAISEINGGASVNDDDLGMDDVAASASEPASPVSPGRKDVFDNFESSPGAEFVDERGAQFVDASDKVAN